MRCPFKCAGAPCLVTMKSRADHAASPSKTRGVSLSAANSAAVFQLPTRTNRSAPGYGNGRHSTALTTLKSAVFAPIPIAKERIAASVKAGLFSNIRMPKRKS